MKSLRALLDNNDVYMAQRRFLDMALVNKAKDVYDRLKVLSGQFLMSYEAQMRNYQRMAQPQKRMMMYVTHFVRVLAMSVERGEIKKSALQEYYGAGDADELLRQFRGVDDAYRLAPSIIGGEKRRIAAGGRPVYNPTVGMVATHYDIFRDIYEQQLILNDKAARALAEVKKVRAEADGLLVDVWNRVEAHYAGLPPETRFDECRRYGVIYYYRKGEDREK